MRLGTTLQLGRLTLKVDAFIVLCIFLSCGMFVSLGFWQLDRAAEKRALSAAYQEAAQAEPVAYESLSHADAERVTNNQRMALQGRFQSEISFLVLYQFFRGQPGYELVTPFRPASGGDLVLISRGWIAPGSHGDRPEVPAVEGEQTLIARVYLPESEIPAGEVTDDSWPVRLPRLNLTQAGRLLGEPVVPYVLRLESDQPGVQARHWSQPDFSTRSHYAYTAQWFGLAALVLLLSFVYASNVLSVLRDR
ncbi:MAG: SURF1 family protein [Pseudohongiella sp.]|uniref:SURF1 family protein n=1 Tax=Pseudohongiella sp. TaxID=1979412 RepID=UPI0034A0521D